MDDNHLHSGKPPDADTSDEQLYDNFRSTRDREAIGILLDRYADRLTLFVYGIVHQAQDTEEIMLDAFAEVASLRTVFRGESGFKTWLFAIAQKLAYQLLRKKRPAFLPLREDLSLEADPPDVALLKEERNRLLYQALNEIKPEYREALYLMYFEELSNEEIQRVTGKSAKQVYNLINRGRAALREKLKGMGFDDA